MTNIRIYTEVPASRAKQGYSVETNGSDLWSSVDVETTVAQHFAALARAEALR